MEVESGETEFGECGEDLQHIDEFECAEDEKDRDGLTTESEYRGIRDEHDEDEDDDYEGEDEDENENENEDDEENEDQNSDENGDNGEFDEEYFLV